VDDRRRLRDILDQTVVLRFPRHRLATFGDSEIHYHLVTPHPEAPSRAVLRTGRVSALRPKILTPDVLARRFEGFGEDATGFERLLRDHFAESFQGLEYFFHNRLDAVEDRHRDARELAQSLQRDLDERDAPRDAVICGPAAGWPLSLMKFMLEETGKSFPANFREIDERGLFDPAGAALRRRAAEVERLFRHAAGAPDRLRDLAARLKEWGLFEEYQDRFFALVKGR
jgi:hypothetical protein